MRDTVHPVFTEADLVIGWLRFPHILERRAEEAITAKVANIAETTIVQNRWKQKVGALVGPRRVVATPKAWPIDPTEILGFTLMHLGLCRLFALHPSHSHREGRVPLKEGGGGG